jgi:hypothetical protein
MLPISDGLTTRRFPIVNVGGFLFGLLVTSFLTGSGRLGLSGGSAVRAPA